MKRWLVWILVAVLLAGCSQESGQVQPAAAIAQVQHISIESRQELPYAGVELSFRLEENSPQWQVAVQAAELFCRTTGAEITLTHEGSTDIRCVEASQLSDTGLADLTQLAGAADYDSHSYASLRQLAIDRCGSLKAIAWQPELLAVYYNRAAFADCGLTEIPTAWEQFSEQSEAICRAGYQPLALDSGHAALATSLVLERIFGWQDVTQLDAGDSRLHAALEQILRYTWAGNVADGWSEDTQQLTEHLGLQNSVMFVGSSAECGGMPTAIDWGVFAMPASGAGSGAFFGGTYLAVDANCSHVQAAFDYIRLLTTGQLDQLLADMTGGIPADPANVCAIAGAADVLQTAIADPGRIPGEMPAALWRGWYRSGAQASNSWK